MGSISLSCNDCGKAFGRRRTLFPHQNTKQLCSCEIYRIIMTNSNQLKEGLLRQEVKNYKAMEDMISPLMVESKPSHTDFRDLVYSMLTMRWRSSSRTFLFLWCTGFMEPIFMTKTEQMTHSVHTQHAERKTRNKTSNKSECFGEKLGRLEDSELKNP